MIILQHCLLVLYALLAVTCTRSTPTGAPAADWMVGKKVFHWTDSLRADPYYGGQRVINVQVWYPITQNGTQAIDSTPFLPGIEHAWRALNGWENEDFKLVESIRTRSLSDHPVSDRESNYPLLVFSPSLGSHASYYTYYAERLAKHGFVVAGITHRYENAFVTDAQGAVYPLKLTYHDSIEQLAIPDDLTADQFRELKSARALVLAEDMVYCLEQLGRINETAFDGRIDFGRLAMWGHSIGGSAATYASMLDPRIKAVLNMDGTPPSAALRTGSHVPFMFLEDLTDYKNHSGYRMQYDRRRDYCLKGSADAYRVMFAGIRHNSFSAFDYHLAETPKEKENAEARLQGFLDYLLRFFEHVLNDQPLDLVELKTDTLEIEVFVK